MIIIIGKGKWARVVHRNASRSQAGDGNVWNWWEYNQEWWGLCQVENKCDSVDILIKSIYIYTHWPGRNEFLRAHSIFGIVSDEQPLPPELLH